MSKVTVSVEKGGSHSVRVTRTSTTTGQEYDAVEVEAGDSRDFDVGEEEQVTVQRGQETKAEDEKADKKKSAK